MKPERDQNNRATYRDNWWIFGEPRRDLRPALAGLPRYIATVETAKHRLFQFLDASILPDNMVIAIASNDAFQLGVLSSSVHEAWALAQGGTLEDRPRYNKSRCFETFPFPDDDTGLTPALRHTIGTLAEQIDTHRKRMLGLLSTPLVQASNMPLANIQHARAAINSGVIDAPANNAINTQNTPDPAAGQELPGADFWAFDSMRPPATPASAPVHTEASALASVAPAAKPNKDLTLTGLYNVLQALREGRPLTAKEKTIHSTGLVGVLKTLRDELDAAVLAAYGWSDLACAQTTPAANVNPSAKIDTITDAKDALLQRLVTLNQRRAAEEAQGRVRWLRPAFQNPLSKQELPAQVQHAPGADLAPKSVTAAATAQAWPGALPEQVKAVANVLASSPQALTLAQITACFAASASLKRSLPTLLQTLEALGRAQQMQVGGITVWRA